MQAREALYVSRAMHCIVGIVLGREATAANVHDSQFLGDLLHGDEIRVWGDSAYAGQGDVIAEHAPRAKDFTHKIRC